MVLIVGAGPAGLALAYELQRRGVSYCVFERGRVGEAWHNHYDRLHLHTLRQVSGLPGLSMPRSYERFPSAAELRTYFAVYARHFRLNITEQSAVKQIEALPNGWRISTDAGLFEGTHLVMATGIWSTPVVLHVPGLAQYAGRVIHSSAYRSAAPFQGQRVLVVGAGNSGCEIAVDLSEHGVQTAIAIRSGVSFVPYPSQPIASRIAAWSFRHFPRRLAEQLVRLVRRDFELIGVQPPTGSLLDAFPVVGFELPEAITRGEIAVFPAVAGIENGRVRFANGQSAAFDTLIMATGFRPTLDLVANQLTFNQHGRPLLDRQWRSLVNPRLFCVGFSYPTTEGWLQAIGRVAREAAASIAEAKEVSIHR